MFPILIVANNKLSIFLKFSFIVTLRLKFKNSVQEFMHPDIISLIDMPGLYAAFVFKSEHST